jgi:RNA polymerase sigma factor (sigma-70 family)
MSGAGSNNRGEHKPGETSVYAKDAKTVDLVESNLRLVDEVAKKYSGWGLERNDIVQEGRLGLIDAARRFDQKKQVKFSTFAVPLIRGKILQALRDHEPIVRLPEHTQRRINRLFKISGQLHQELGRMPTDGEIAGAMEIDVDKVRLLVKMAYQKGSSVGATLTGPRIDDNNANRSSLPVPGGAIPQQRRKPASAPTPRLGSARLTGDRHATVLSVLMELQGISDESLAKRCGVNVKTVMRWRLGENSPTEDDVRNRLDELFGGFGSTDFIFGPFTDGMLQTGALDTSYTEDDDSDGSGIAQEGDLSDEDLGSMGWEFDDEEE